MGSFGLYYELDSTYDPSKPTVMVVADAQTTESSVGRADYFKNSFELSYNVVTYQYRGFFCSRIDAFNNGRPTDWKLAFEVLNSDNAVEDIERIRRDLEIPREKFFIAGGSGMAVLALKYLSVYHEQVSKAFLLSFFKDAAGCSNGPLLYFDHFLDEHRLRESFMNITGNRTVPPGQLYYIIQRLLYVDQDKTVRMIEELAQGNRTLYDQLDKETGSVGDFIRDGQKWPHFTVFMYETNLPPANGKLDINYPYYAIGEPLQKLAARGKIPYSYWDVKNLDKVSTEVFIVGGSYDQVIPVSATEPVRDLLPHSKMAVFKGYHCLNGNKELRNPLMESFFTYGYDSPQMDSLLGTEPLRSALVWVR